MLFNNCHNKPHEELYGAGAFYGLTDTPPKRKKAESLTPKQLCCMASSPEDGKIEFSWYRLENKRLMASAEQPDEKKWVFFGELLASETLSKSAAKETEWYAQFFDKNGDFKRHSAIRPKGSFSVPPHLTVDDGPTFYPDEAGTDATGREGAVRQVAVNAYERNPKFRRQCIVEHGTECCICGISFGEEYGSEAEGYIHVHHLRPLSEVGKEHTVNPVEDMRPVCPNCHAVVHLGGGCRNMEDVRQLRLRQGRTVSRQCR